MSAPPVMVPVHPHAGRAGSLEESPVPASVPDIDDTARRAPLLPPQDARVIWLLLGAAFVTILNETTMGVAIPRLIDDLRITAVDAQWITTAFMLTMAVVIPVTGFLLQRFATRAVYIAAMTLFSAGTLLAAVAPGFWMLVVARVVQASGTAIMMPLLMTTLLTLVPPAIRGRMMGRVSLVISLAPAAGPTLSGLVLDSLGWRWVFALVLPFALVMLAVGARWMRPVGETRDAPVDVVSVVLSAFGFGGLVFGLSRVGIAVQAGGAAAAVSTGIMIGSFAVGLVALALFVWRQVRLQRVDDALLDLRVFRSRDFTLSILQMALLSAGFFGATTVVPLLLQHALGLNAAESGLVVLPGAVAMGALAPLIGRVYDARGPRVLLVPGAIVATTMLWCYSLVGVDTPLWLIVAIHTTLAMGLTLSFTPLFTASLGALTPKFYSHGSAVIGTVQQLAGAAGIALLIAVMSAVAAAAHDAGASVAAAQAAGARTAFLLAALLCVPTVLGAFLIRKPEGVL